MHDFQQQPDNPHGTLDYRTEYHKLRPGLQAVDFYLSVRRHWRLFPPTS